MRFPRQARLTTKQDFTRVFDQASRFSHGGFTSLARSNTLGHARLGLAVAKRNVRLATGRNRIKRLVREGFRQHLDHLCGVDIIFLVRPGVADRGNRALHEALERHWNRLIEQCRQQCKES